MGGRRVGPLRHSNLSLIRALLAACLCAAGTPCAVGQSSQSPVFAVDVRLVRLLATVRSPQGAPVGDLRREEFRVFEQGVPQEIAVFEARSDQPLSLALLIDTSLSTKVKLPAEKESVRTCLKAFFETGGAEDAVSLFRFDWQVSQETGFTRDLRWLEERLAALKPEGGTSLYDALFLASRELDRRGGRHVALVVSDGADTVSTKDYHAALRALHDADTVLYAVLVIPVEAAAGRSVRGENALASLCSSTGGRMITTAVGPAMDGAFTEILRELRTQYYLGYYPRNTPPTSESFRRVRVEVTRPGYTVQSRNGYYAPPDIPSAVPSSGPKRIP